MFSKELEEVIEAALADGVITEKELAVLHKRAAAEGVDPDELDVVIEGRLSKMKKEEDWLRPAPPSMVNNGKHGVVRKCPHCGATVEAGTVKCPECEYEFVGVANNSTMELLARKLEKIDAKFSNKNEYKDREVRNNELANAISSIPIPTTREDLLEFICSMYSKTKYGFDSDNERITSAYRQKYEECINKAKVYFSGDAQFEPLFEQYRKYKSNIWGNLTPGVKEWIIFGMVAFFFLLICLLLYLWVEA